MINFRFSIMVRMALLAAVLATITSCAKLTLAWADLKPDGVVASPSVLGVFMGQLEVTSAAQWRGERAPALRAAFEREVYGAMPDDYEVEVLSRKMLDDDAFGGQLIEYKLQANVMFGDGVNQTNLFYMDVALPKGVERPPIILMETFCPRWDTMPHSAVARVDGLNSCKGGGAGEAVMSYVFGRYIATPPIEMILSLGYGVATIFPSEFVADNKEAGLQALEALSVGHDGVRWGAIGAWAWGFSAMIDVLENDPAIVASPMISWGHSRYGKAALVAAVFDERIDAVIAHQSGTGGASLNRNKKGESVATITETYPHWFASPYAEMAGSEEKMDVDQHQLLALIAPRPVLLGNARRDVWSDPNGAFRAAQGADPVYELLGVSGLSQTRLDEWVPSAELAFWLRPGTHGVVKEDWPAFLDFLDAHFK